MSNVVGDQTDGPANVPCCNVQVEPRQFHVCVYKMVIRPSLCQYPWAECRKTSQARVSHCSNAELCVHKALARCFHAHSPCQQMHLQSQGPFAAANCRKMQASGAVSLNNLIGACSASALRGNAIYIGSGLTWDILEGRDLEGHLDQR